MRTRSGRALAVVILPALLAGACAKGSSSGSLGLTPGARLAAAAVKTSAAKSARMHMVMKMTGLDETPDQPANVTIEADGRMEIGRPRGVLTMDMGSLGIPGADGKMEMRLVDNVVYMKIPDFRFGEELKMPDGKKWMKLDVGAAAEEEGFNLADFQNFGMNDPSELLDFLKKAGSVSKVGSDTVRGQSSTHYKAMIDFDKILAEAEVTEREDVKEFAGKMKAMPVDVWIGDDGYLRRMDFTMDFSGLEEMGKNAKMNATMEMFDFGVSVVDVVAPPAAEVIDMNEMFDEGGGYEEPAA